MSGEGSGAVGWLNDVGLTEAELEGLYPSMSQLEGSSDSFRGVLESYQLLCCRRTWVVAFYWDFRMLCE